MSNYTVRIEFFGAASDETYQKLHEAMKTRKFSKSFKEGDNVYELPRGEYICQSDLTTSELLSSAREAAVTVWEDFCVFVTKSESRWEYYNLKSLQ